MSDSDRKQRNIMMVAILVSAIVMRLVPHVPNFAPVTAAALFAAAYLPKRYALILPLIGVAIGDYLLLYVNPFGNPVFDFSQVQPVSALVNDTTAFVWGSFMISGLLGLLLRKKQNALRVGAISMIASLQFFIITNFAVWAAGAYARDLSGLAASYAAGLPFLRWTILGDLFYVASFFGLYAFALRISKNQSKPALLPQPTT